MDHQPTDSRKSRLEELLWIIGGCEVAIRNNDKERGKPMSTYVPDFSREFRKLQQKYLKKLERVMNGLPEDES